MKNQENAIGIWHENARKEGWKVTSLKKVGNNFMESLIAEKDEVKRLLFLRQNSVIIVPIIKWREQIFTLLGEEFRSGIMKKCLGFPAGSLDKLNESVIDGAERELLEETPIEEKWITNRSEINVGENNYVSPGGTNEQIFLYRFDVKIPDKEDIYDLLEGKTCGVATENEEIISKVVKFNRDLIFQLPIESHKLAVSTILLDEVTKILSLDYKN